MSPTKTPAPAADAPTDTPDPIEELRQTYPDWRFWRALGTDANRPWNATRRNQIDWSKRPEGYASTLFGTPAQLREQLEQQPDITQE